MISYKRLNSFLRKTFLHLILPLVHTPKRTSLLGKLTLYNSKTFTNNNKINLSTIRSILVLRLDEIGDIVLTTPFIRELRNTFPGAWITLVVKKQTLNLVEHCPYVDEILVFNCRKTLRYNWKTAGERNLVIDLYWITLKFALQYFRKRHFDLAIVPRWDADYYHASFLAFFSKAFYRVAYSEYVTEVKKNINHDFDTLFTNISYDNTPRHDVICNLNLLQFLGGQIGDENLELWLHPSDEIYAEQLLQAHNLSPGSLMLAFGIGAGHEKRKWPIDRYIELGKWAIRHQKAHILLVGGKEDKQQAHIIHEHFGNIVINATGRTSLRQTAALLKKSQIYIGSDSGAMHIMAATGGSVIEISCHPHSSRNDHYNSPLRFGPWKVPHIVLQPATPQPPCSDGCAAEQPHCILNISVKQVKDALRFLLKKKHSVI